MKKSFSWYLVKIDRISAWTLLVSMFAYFVSGYGMTKGIISSSLAISIHNHYLPLVLISAFSFHTAYAISLALRRWRIWNRGTKSLLLVLYFLFLVSFFYIDKFYKKPLPTETTTAPSQTEDDFNRTTTSKNSQAVSQQLTLTELSKFNGQNGQPSYVAVDGIVYDLSSVFNSGKHYSHIAGQELTTDFYTIHAKSQITKYPVVGTIK